MASSSPEGLQEGEIRLMTIEPASDIAAAIKCSTHMAALADAPEFEALSYRWGDAGITENVSVNGQPFQATTNLASALRRLRQRGKSHHLWVDAICIDQSSIAEKNMQVPLMRTIYSQATRVLIWLGEEADNSGAAFALLKRWAAAVEAACETEQALGYGEETGRPPPLRLVLRHGRDLNLFDELGRDAIAALVGRDYWRRVWVVQEVVLARTRVLLCGRDEIAWEHFHRGLNQLLDLPELNEREEQEEQVDAATVTRMAVPYGVAAVIMLTAWERKLHQSHPEGFPGDRILVTLTKFFRFEATDLRDKIYGLLGLLDHDNELGLEADYNLGMNEVSLALVKAEMQASGRLDGLGFAGMNTTPRAAATNLPSWTWDVSGVISRNLGLGFMRSVLVRTPWNAAGTRPACFGFPDSVTLQAQGFVCETVARTCSTNVGAPLHTMDWIWGWASLARSCASQSPYTIPWRRAFLSAISAETFTLGPGNAGFDDAAGDGARAYYRQTEAMMSLLRYEALKVIRRRLAQNPAMPDEDLPEELPIKEDSTPFTDRLRTLEPDADDEELFYWAENSSATASPAQRKRHLDAFLGTLDSETRLAWPLGDEYGRIRSATAFNEVANSMSVIGRAAAFFVTSQGHYGLLPPTAEEGDLVCCVYGCAVPLIVRRMPGGKVMLMGEAYVYGMMWGEMVDGPQAVDWQALEEDFVFM
jgi:hypothetical protein